MNYNKIILLLMIVIVGIGAVSAADSFDDSTDTVSTIQTDQSNTNEVSTTQSDDTDNIEINKNIKEQQESTITGDNPESYTQITQDTTYENAVITLNDDQTTTDSVVTFKNNVTLTSLDGKKTLNNYKIIINGENVTINNIIFNHDTNTDAKLIDVTGGNNVLINNTDITITKSNNVDAIAVNIKDASNVIINNADINVKATPQGLWYQDENDNWYNQLKVAGINMDNSNNVEVINTNVQLSNTTVDIIGATNPAIVIKNQSNTIKIVNNTLNVTGATYNYGILSADYVNKLNITSNNIDVNGILYNAGIDASTSVASDITYNNITVNSINTTQLSNGNEALAYGIILATYYTNNTDNIVSYNNINLIANVGYGIENYLGENNNINYNNITIDAKRTIAIATNASNNNHYAYNNIKLYCNDEDINDFYEAIPAQNVGIIIIDSKNNNIQYNNITIYDDSTNTNVYAIILDSDSVDNTVVNNILYVYNNNGISKQGYDAILDLGLTNNVNSNLLTQISQQKGIKSKNIENGEGEVIIIDTSNISQYGNSNTSVRIDSNVPSNSHIILNLDGFNTSYKRVYLYLYDPSVTVEMHGTGYYSILCRGETIVNTYMPWATLALMNQPRIINSTFLNYNQETQPATLENSVVLTKQPNTYSFDAMYDYNFFDTNTHLLHSNMSEDSNIILRQVSNNNAVNKYTRPLIINKPINLISYDSAIYGADITFVAGSEGSNITGLTVNGKIYINTTGISVKNNTINGGIVIKDTGEASITENVFDTVDTAIVIEGGISNIISNNNITAASEYTITLDEDSIENTITDNSLQAAELTGVDSVLDEGEDNTISSAEEEPVIIEPVLKVDTTEFTVGESATITARIYKGDEVATDITGGKVVFKVNGVTLKDANGEVIYVKLVNGEATIADYVVPDSWNKEGLTITAVYSGTTVYDALRSEAFEITISAPEQTEPTLTLENVDAKVKSTIELKATIKNGDTPINSGKVIFKVNGKTVKDANGKIIYVNVVDGIASIDYALPTNLKTGTYTITATFTASGYERLEDTKTLTLTA